MVQTSSSVEGSGACAILVSGLGTEILDDHFLDMTEFVMQIAQRKQGLDALQPRLADTDQQPGGKWNRLFAGEPHGFEANGRVLIGRAIMRPAFFAEARAGHFRA